MVSLYYMAQSQHKKWSLYVLKLENDKWYIGITSKTPEERYWQHKNGYLAAKWTKKYKPLGIHDTKDLGGVLYRAGPAL